MKMKKLLILKASLFLSACSYLPFFQEEPVVPVEVKTIQERPPMWHPPLPVEMSMLDVEFEVLTPELTTQQYQNLSLNMAEIKRYTKNILAIIQYYREYDEKLDSDNDD